VLRPDREKENDSVSTVALHARRVRRAGKSEQNVAIAALGAAPPTLLEQVGLSIFLLLVDVVEIGKRVWAKPVVITLGGRLVVRLGRRELNWRHWFPR
jgi:hypothetical protein